MDGVALNFVDDLNSGRDFWSMKARVIRLWKINGFRWDMILIDERGRKIQAHVKSHLVPQFESVLQEDVAILIRKFGVAAQNDRYPVVNLPHKINFFKCTDVQAVTTFNGHPYGFNFISFTDIKANKLPAGALTVDVIGRIAWCGDLQKFKSAGKESKRINMDLQDYEGNVLRCTLWGSYAEEVNAFIASNQSSEMVIVVIQHGRSKEWGGQYTVQNDKYSTRLFMNVELKEACDLRRRIILKDGPSTSQHALSSQTSYPLRDEFVLKTPRICVDEVIEVDSEASFVVVGTISMVEEANGWFYKAHRKCHKKVVTKTEYLEQAKVIPENFIDAPFDSLWCLKCTSIADSLVPMFKVQFRVQDSTGSVSFVMFDKDVYKLIGVTANDIRERQLKTGEMDHFPHELLNLNNKLLAFKIVVSKYNLENKYHVYTVSKICDDAEVVEELQNRGNLDELSPDEGEQQSVKLDDSSQLGPDSKDCASVTDSCLVADVEKDCASSPAAKRVMPPVLDQTTADKGSAVRVVKKKLSN